MIAPPIKPPTLLKPPVAPGAAVAFTTASATSATLKPPISLPASKPPPAAKRPAKTFKVEAWTGNGEGEKVLVYGPNGMGKTTLASMAPEPVFIGFDDGGRKIKHPKTGADLNAIKGVETFEDLRDALHQYSLFTKGGTMVLDTITLAEAKAVAYMLANVKSESGKVATNIEDYGYGKGFNYLLDPMRLLMTDMDDLVRRGVNILLLAQQGTAKVVNKTGMDYLQDGPTLESRPASGNNVRGEICGWVDNIFRIGYPDVSVVATAKNATKGKAHGETTRQIYTEPEVHFVAKNRMNGVLPAVVSYETRADDSIWQFLFHGATVQQ